ncbi:fimbrial protein [Serratia sp. IR-2025]|nr:fimbrial A protein [Serratia marcescens]
MKMKKIIMCTVMAFGMSSFVAQAADQGHGKVTFTGSIIDAPCSISPESSDQTVDLGQISNVALKNGGQSNPRPFSIDLENCSFEAIEGVVQKNKVAVTFSGMESSSVDGLLGITGTAKGAAVAITDGAGDTIKLGQPTKAQALQEGNNTLNFSAYLQGATASSAVIIPGDFQAVADFTLAYN